MKDPETRETIEKKTKAKTNKTKYKKKTEIINDEQHGEPRYSQRVIIFCFLSDAHCVTNIVNSDKSIVGEQNIYVKIKISIGICEI